MSLPRDGGDPETPDIHLARPERQRSRGRTVPDPKRESDTLVDIVVGGVVAGTVNTRTLKARAQFDLEDGINSPMPARALLTWLTTYAGISERELPQIKEELAELEVGAIIDLFLEISQAIGRGMRLPNASPRASRRP